MADAHDAHEAVAQLRATVRNLDRADVETLIFPALDRLEATIAAGGDLDQALTDLRFIRTLFTGGAMP